MNYSCLTRDIRIHTSVAMLLNPKTGFVAMRLMFSLIIFNMLSSFIIEPRCENEKTGLLTTSDTKRAVQLEV